MSRAVIDSFPILPAALNRQSGIALHEQLVTLQAAITAGQLRAGEQLPAEHQLAADLGVARGTIRQALMRLEQAGLLERRHGRGTFVATQVAVPPSETATAVLPHLQERYVSALLAGDGDDAVATVLTALQQGLSAAVVTEELLRPAAYAIGAQWQAGQVSVAVEHRAAAIIERDLTDLHRHAPRLPATGCTLVIGCVAGEPHTLGCRMVADAFERAGWTVHYLGADVPLAALVALAHAVAADLVGVSVTMPACLPRVADLVQGLHAGKGPSPPVLVGGQPFIENGGLVRALGAWQTAASPAAAVQLATTHLHERTTTEPAS